MSKAERPLDEAVRDRSFTPGERHIDGVVALLAREDEVGDAAEQAIGRMGEAAGRISLARLVGASGVVRRRLARVLGKAAARGVDGCAEAVRGLLRDDDARVRRVAARVVGELRKEWAEAALVDAFERETDAPTRKAMAEALGKVGGAGARASLEGYRPDDAEGKRVRSKAMLVLTRDERRGEPSSIDTGAALPEGSCALFYTRRGLEAITAGEIAARGIASDAAKVGHGLVRATVGGLTLARLHEARTFMRVGFALPAVKVAGEAEVASALSQALSSREAQAIRAALSRGPSRFRIDWGGEGHRRALSWAAAASVNEAASGWENDPSDSSWEVSVARRDGSLWAVVIPKKDVDERFAYRVADVPASSHPTIAAALARVGGVRGDDVVWDPFAGSGLELIERARLGPYGQLIATDRDERALEALSKNVASAGVVRLRLLAGDARRVEPGTVSLVISNPPMGRRVGRGSDVEQTLCDVVHRAARLLGAGGRLVWLSPSGARTAQAGASAGLAVERRGGVDLGGFEAELQVMTRVSGRGGR